MPAALLAEALRQLEAVPGRILSGAPLVADAEPDLTTAALAVQLGARLRHEAGVHRRVNRSSPSDARVRARFDGGILRLDLSSTPRRAAAPGLPVGAPAGVPGPAPDLPAIPGLAPSLPVPFLPVGSTPMSPFARNSDAIASPDDGTNPNSAGRDREVKHAFAFELLSVDCGAAPLVQRTRSGAAVVEHTPAGVCVPRGAGVFELYEDVGNGVEQSWLLLDRPEIAADLRIRGEITTDLVPAQRESRRNGLQFLDARTGERVLRFGAVTVVDAAGRRLPCASRVQGGELEIRVPAAWVRDAQFPIVVDPVIGSSFQVSSGDGDKSNPAIAYDSTQDQFLSVYEHVDGSTYEILGQVFDTDGTLSGSQITVATGSSVVSRPKVSYSPAAERYLVVWQESGTTIKARLLNDDGTAYAAAFTVDNGSGGTSVFPDVGYRAAEDQWCVVWSDSATSGSGLGLVGQLIGSDGSVDVDDFVLQDSNDDLTRSDLCANETRDEFWVAFENSTTGEVKAFAFDGAVTALTTSVITVASTTNDQHLPATSWNSVDDEYMVVYLSDQFTSGIDKVYGRRFEPAAGSPRGDPFCLSLIEENGKHFVKSEVVFSPEPGIYHVFLYYSQQGGAAAELIAQDITAAGALSGSAYGVALWQRNDRGPLSVAAAYGSAVKETLCVWPDTSDPEADVDIYGRRIETGEPLIQQEPVHNAIRLGGNGSVLGHSGEFVWTVQVAHIAGVGFPFEFTATYRSGATVDGAIGFGWDHSLNLGIEFSGTAGASDATFFDGTGRRFIFEWNGTGWDTPAGLYNTLTWASSTPVLTDRHGTVYTFGRSAESSFYDGRRLLTSIADRNGNTLTITYLSGDDHRIDTVTDTRGETIDFAWTQDKRLESITDWADRVWSLEYDGAGDLVATTTPATSTYPYGNRTSYTYAGSQPKSWLDHNLVVICGPNNQQSVINNFEPLTDRVDTQQYGTSNQVYDLRYFTGRTREVNRRGNATDHYFGDAGVCTQLVDAAGNPWLYEYNAHLERTQETRPRGNTIQWTFDSGSSTRVAQGNLLEIRRKDESLGSAADIVWSFTYESHFQFVKTVVSPRTYTTTLVYDYESSATNHGNLIEIDYPTITAGQPSNQTIVVTMAYNAKGQMTSLTDGEGFTDSYAYYGASHARHDFLQSRTVASGSLNLTTTWGYNSVGVVTSVEDPNGNTTTYTVDERDRVLVVTPPAPLDNHTTTYLWDPNGNLQRMDVADIDENGDSQGLGSVTTVWSYDILDHVTAKSRWLSLYSEAVTTFTRNAEDAVELTELPEGNQIQTQYNSRELVASETRGYGTADASTNQFTYDTNGNLTQRTLYPNANEYNVFTIDGFDRTIKDTDAMGHFTEWVFDASSNVTVERRVNASNVTLKEATRFYDAIERCWKIERLFKDSGGSAVGDGVATTLIRHDRNSRVTLITDDNGDAVTRTHNQADQLTKVVDALGESVGNKVEYGHDANGNVTSVTSTEYNQFSASAEVLVTSYAWDVRNRNTQITEDDGGLELETQRKYDSHGNEVVDIDPEGQTTRRTYDAQRCLTSTTFDQGGLGITLAQTWDLNARLVSQTDGNGNTTAYAYNARDLVSEITYADTTTKAFTYCGCCGRLKTITDQNGTVVTNSYNDAGQLTQRDITRGTGVVGTTREIFTVDGAYRRTRAENKEGATTISVCEYHFNTLDLVDTEVQQIGGGTARTLTGTYDGAGNLLTCAYPGGRTITREYDDTDRVTEVKQGSSVLAAYEWAGQRVARRTYLNGIKKEVQFDSARRTTQIRHVNGSNQEKAKLQYAYTAASNKKYEHRVHDAVADVYRYDGIYQVTGVKFGVPSADVSSSNAWDDYDTWTTKHEWGLDQAGNRETMDRDGTTETYNTVSGTYTPDPMNEYYLVNGVAQTHDANGNLTDDGVNSYEYNYANQLMKVTRNSDSAVLGAYGYAADRRRIERVVGSDTQHYYWWGWQLAETRDGSANVVETHVWGVWIDELLTSDLGSGGGTRYYFHENAIGSVCQATNTSGLVVEEYKYTDIYGKVVVYACSDSGGSRTLTSVSGTQIGNRTLFQGREWDGEAAIYGFRWRSFSSQNGRFLQHDPAGVDSLGNAYRFVANHPITAIDPCGLNEAPSPGERSRRAREDWLTRVRRAFPEPFDRWLGKPMGTGGYMDRERSTLCRRLREKLKALREDARIWGGLGMRGAEAASSAQLDDLKRLFNELGCRWPRGTAPAWVEHPQWYAPTGIETPSYLPDEDTGEAPDQNGGGRNPRGCRPCEISNPTSSVEIRAPRESRPFLTPMEWSAFVPHVWFLMAFVAVGGGVGTLIGYGGLAVEETGAAGAAVDAASAAAGS